MIVALDSEAFNALAGPDSARKQHVRRILAGARRLERKVLVASLVLAELYRGRGRNLQRLAAPYPHVIVERI